MRTEFGFYRTVADTPQDLLNCQHMPSFLMPSDLDRISARFGCNPLDFAKEHLLASPGALVIRNGAVMRIPTLVVARDPDTGHCKFLKDDRCAIHSDAPFGCAFFDFAMDETEGDRRSRASMEVLIKEWQDPDSGYRILWELLDGMGRCAPKADDCRRKIRAELALLSSE